MISNVQQSQKLTVNSKLETLPEVAEEIYQKCLSGVEIDPYFFPENYSELLKILNEQIGWSYDCHSFTSGFLKLSGINNIPHLKATDERWPISVNPNGCLQGYFDNCTFNLISSLIIDNPDEAKRKAHFNSYIMDNSNIREVIYEDKGEYLSLPDATHSLTQQFIDCSKSRLGMIVSLRYSGVETIEKFDRHSFIVLGPSSDFNDLFIIEREEIGMGFNGLRVKKLSDLVDYYQRFHSIKDEIAFLDSDLAEILNNL